MSGCWQNYCGNSTFLTYFLNGWLMGRLTVQLQGSDNKTSEYVIDITNQKIAEDLASSREVISRLLKKFELEGLFKQVVFLKYRSLLEIKLILPISTR